MKRYEKSCLQCKRKFTCSGHCYTKGQEYLIRKNNPCICYNCDGSPKFWKDLCNRKWMKCNPSRRDCNYEGN